LLTARTDAVSVGIEEEPGMSQQEDVVAHDAGQDDRVGSPQAVSPAGEEDLEVEDRLEADDAEFDADREEADGEEDEAGGDESGPGGAESPERPPRLSVADLELEGEIAADYIEGLLDVADLDGDIDMDVEGDRAVVSVVGATLDELVGRRGEVLEALQELTRLAVHKQTGNRTRMMLDVGGYRQRRRAELAEAGQDAAEEVRRTGQPKRMWPMNPFERKVVHDAVAAAGLRSESEGEEPERRVVVLPVG
jgi:spoIIIJ-associated protein